MNGKSKGRKAEDVNAIPVDVVRERIEAEPAEDQRESDGNRNEAAPHDAQMSQTAQPAAADDEPVEGEQDADAPAELLDVFPEVAAAEEDLPAALPVQGRRRPLQPHGVAIGQAEGCEQGGEGVADQCRVKFPQVTRPQDDQEGESSADQQPPQESLDLLARHVRASSLPWARQTEGRAGEQVRSILPANKPHDPSGNEGWGHARRGPLRALCVSW